MIGRLTKDPIAFARIGIGDITGRVSEIAAEMAHAHFSPVSARVIRYSALAE
jgi:hypothetical protein